MTKVGIVILLFKISFSQNSFCKNLRVNQEQYKSLASKKELLKAYKARGFLALYRNRNSEARKFFQMCYSLSPEDAKLCELLAIASLRENDRRGVIFWMYQAHLNDLARFYLTIKQPFECSNPFQNATCPMLSTSYPVVPIEIDGHFFAFLIDTGASTSIVDKQVAEALGLKERGASELVLSNGERIQGALSTLPILRIGSLAIKNVPVILIEKLKPLSFDAKNCFHGVLGTDLLSRFNILIDYQTKKIVISKKAMELEAAFLSGSKLLAEIPFLFSPQGLLLVKGSMQSKEIFFIYDTGSGGYPLEFNQKYRNIFFGFSGTARSSLRFGPVAIKKISETFTQLPSDLEEREEIPIGGIIGNRLFSRYKVLLNFQKMVLQLYDQKN
ncbi:retroviral-like aspartic protease family protein [Methylacidiphilum fumariolicum]|uniref:Predicted aspartyl protease n=3 Tax=Candidatus Methylacidiphilum fumarolicum TaxID=591154 RepID=A0ABM9IA23_9BACT|nr:retropepsin-like aspartic protease [Candidatus Methylacidiphilum fumarolicum]MBW6415491.1 retroviral-like aspartic protease family protein [Candidatus Methylacidiphilum fumarolicum]CAI9084483.1 Putative Predicted aspartyl protease [Candidatus Methylacidiphilum fumarolicum]CCG93359.1 putative Predicted aspartyl protease [Methylacidiphilum fumariolicum SolV]